MRGMNGRGSLAGSTSRKPLLLACITITAVLLGICVSVAQTTDAKLFSELSSDLGALPLTPVFVGGETTVGDLWPEGHDLAIWFWAPLPELTGDVLTTICSEVQAAQEAGLATLVVMPFGEDAAEDLKARDADGEFADIPEWETARAFIHWEPTHPNHEVYNAFLPGRRFIGEPPISLPWSYVVSATRRVASVKQPLDYLGATTLPEAPETQPDAPDAEPPREQAAQVQDDWPYNPALLATGWPTLGGNGRNTYYVPYSAPKAPALAWRLDVQFWDPCLLDGAGHLYLGRYGELIRLADTGATADRVILDASSSSGAVPQFLTSDGRIIYQTFSLMDGQLTSIVDGKPLWRLPVERTFFMLVRQAPSGILLLITPSSIAAIDHDGLEEWSVQLEDGSFTEGAAMLDDGTLLCCAKGGMHKYEWLWVGPDGQIRKRAPASLSYLGRWSGHVSHEGTVVALTAEGVRSVHLDHGERRYPYLADLAAIDPVGAVYLVEGRRVTAFDSIDGLSGRPRWVFDSDLGDFISNPVLTADGALILGAKGGIYCLNVTNRHVIWTLKVANPLFLALGVDSTLYTQEGNGEFDLLSFRDSAESEGAQNIR